MRGRSWRPSARRWCRRGPASRGGRGSPYKVAPEGLNYATVHKTRKKGRVVEVATRVIFGTAATVEAALAESAASRTVNTAFVERHNGTDRNRNAEGAEDVLLLEGLVDSSGGDLLQQVQFQLLLAGADAEGERRRGSDTGHDGEVDRSCVDASGVDQATGYSTCVGHNPSTGGRVKPLQRGTDQGPR